MDTSRASDAGKAVDLHEDILASLPVLAPGRRFQFSCHPGIRCFNACCTDLYLVLSPYDVMRLRRNLDMPSHEFHAQHTEAAAMPITGFPMHRLLMRDDAAKSCPFVRPAGCSVYGDRPGACRTYPLGRAARVNAQLEVSARLHVVREEHCLGFAAGRSWTGEEWLTDQDLVSYNAMSDRYLALIARCEQQQVILDARQRDLAELALYRLDRFQGVLRETMLLERLDVPADQRHAILADEEAALGFALDWLGAKLFAASRAGDR